MQRARRIGIGGANQLTVMFVITDTEGEEADCVTYGDNVDFFRSECTDRAP